MSGGIPVPTGTTRIGWLKARKSGLGASDTAAVLGLSPYATPLDIWLDKTSPTVDESAGEAAEWGQVLESAIARRVNTLYRKRIGHVRPSPGLLRHPDHDWMLATPDRYVEPDGVLEIKTAGHRQEWRWKDGPPAFYQVQVQQQLAVTGRRVGWIAALIGGQRMPEPFRIDRDEAVIEQIVAYAGAWWQKHIVEGVAPEPTWPADDDNMTKVWSADPERVCHADDDTEALVERLRAAKARLASAKKEEAALAFEVKALMREATELRWHDEPLATWAAHQRNDFDVTGFRADHPDLAAQYKRTSTIRTLRLKQMKGDDDG